MYKLRNNKSGSTENLPKRVIEYMNTIKIIVLWVLTIIFSVSFIACNNNQPSNWSQQARNLPELLFSLWDADQEEVCEILYNNEDRYTLGRKMVDCDEILFSFVNTGRDEIVVMWMHHKSDHIDLDNYFASMNSSIYVAWLDWLENNGFTFEGESYYGYYYGQYYKNLEELRKTIKEREDVGWFYFLSHNQSLDVSIWGSCKYYDNGYDDYSYSHNGYYYREKGYWVQLSMSKHW